MPLQIVTGADAAVLRTKAEPIPQVTKAIRKLAKEMEVAMNGADGVGIAGPQVGENKRIFLATLNAKTDDARLQVFINPDITYYSEETNIDEEGCLSLPDQFGKVARSNEVIIEFTDLSGQQQTLKLSGFDARVVQHEFDHLNGVLFIDKLV